MALVTYQEVAMVTYLEMATTVVLDQFIFQEMDTIEDTIMVILMFQAMLVVILEYGITKHENIVNIDACGHILIKMA